MNKNTVTNLFALLGLIVVGWLIFGMIGRVEKKLAFFVDGMEVSGRTSLTVGKNSDICFNRVPHDFLTVTAEGDHFRWTVNQECRDSLQYFKINNENPNLHRIIDSKDQRISLTLFTSSRDSFDMNFTGADVWRTWNRFSKQQYVLARHFATFQRFSEGVASDSIKSVWLNQMQQQDVRSFFYKTGDDIVMVILDEHTHITASRKLYDESLEGDSVIRYVREGRTASGGDMARSCKVQFFDVNDHCYKESKPDDGYFQIDGVNYVMKASVKLTEWGAGHVMIKNKNGSLSISYPRPISFVGTADTLCKKSLLSSGHITIKQNNKSFPSNSDLYLPTFSNAINFDLCNLEFNADSGVVKVRDNNFKTTVIRENSFTFRNLKSSLVPTIAKVDLNSGNDTLKCRIGFIGKHFILSYLYMPLAVLLVLLCLVWHPWSPLRVEDPSGRELYNPEQLKSYPLYLTMLLLVCFCYCACKSLIALKLSYTYPYFEKMTGIVPVSTSLMILLFFSVCMLLNVRMAKEKGKFWGNLINWGTCLLLSIGLGYVFFKVMDSNISYNVLDSYFGEEKMTWKFWNWHKSYMVGIKDTHRSVVFTLLLAEGFVLAVWLIGTAGDILSAMKKRFPLLFAKIFSFFVRIRKMIDWERNGRKYEAVLSAIEILVAVVFIIRVVSLESLVSILYPNTFWKIVAEIFFIILFILTCRGLIEALKALFPWHVILLVVLAGVGLFPGNYATAFITLMVILGLSKALSDAAEEVNKSLMEEGVHKHYFVLFKMLFITLFYIIFAMIGDNGYLTNYIGFFMCVICLFLIVKRPERNEHRIDDVASRHEKFWTYGILGLVLVAIGLLPFVCQNLFDTEDIHYSRMTRRIMLYSNFEKLQESGYRYSESDAEFMVIMNHAMQQRHKGDPLSHDAHFMHPSVSSGQSPVVLNDLSLPIAFFGSYGVVVTTVVYILLLLLLAWLVLCYTFGAEDKDLRLDVCLSWRLLALFMWIGTSLYIYFSYLGCLPFTGRLNPGYGVDAVGEALETAFLLAFMGSVTYKYNRDFPEKFRGS